MDVVSDLLKLLPTLNVDQLKAIRQKIDLNLSDGGAKPVVRNGEDWITPAFGEELKRRSLITIPPSALYKIGPPGYCERAEAVQKLLLRQAGRELGGGERLLLGSFVARALADYLVSVLRMTVGPRVIMRSIDVVPEAVEYAYPGYLEAGLIGFLIRRR